VLRIWAGSPEGFVPLLAAAVAVAERARKLAVLVAEQARFLHTFGLPFYNLRGVVPDMKRPRCRFKNVTCLMSPHRAL
jgi:hypothetical protein